jgi:hypothetical protein
MLPVPHYRVRLWRRFIEKLCYAPTAQWADIFPIKTFFHYGVAFIVLGLGEPAPKPRLRRAIITFSPFLADY